MQSYGKFTHSTVLQFNQNRTKLNREGKTNEKIRIQTFCIWQNTSRERKGNKSKESTESMSMESIFHVIKGNEVKRND